MLYRTFSDQPLNLKQKNNHQTLAQCIRTCVSNRNSSITPARGIFAPWKKPVPTWSPTMGQERPTTLVIKASRDICRLFHIQLGISCGRTSLLICASHTRVSLLTQPYPPSKPRILQSLGPLDPTATPIVTYPDESTGNSIREDKKGIVPVPEGVLKQLHQPPCPKRSPVHPRFPKVLFSHPLAMVQKRPRVFMASKESRRLLLSASLCNPEQNKGHFPGDFFSKPF